MKKIVLVLLFVALISSVAFAEAPEERISELESKVAKLQGKTQALEGNLKTTQQLMVDFANKLTILEVRVAEIDMDDND